MTFYKKPEITYADENTEIPQTLTASRKFGEVTMLAPRGNPDADIMFVSACPLEEEADSQYSPPNLLKGGPGVLFIRSLLKCGLDVEDCWTTTILKHCLERKQKLKPKKPQVERNQHLIVAEIKKVKPKLIVCLGKPTFDYFSDVTLKMREALGGLFFCERHNCMIYCMDTMQSMLEKPELIERMYVDMREIRRTLQILQGVEVPRVKLKYETINTEAQLTQWVNRMTAENYKVFSVDCEWKGNNFVDGQLRYTQFCWAAGEACCLQFYDQVGTWKFDCTQGRVREILSAFFKNPFIQFIGHNIAADSVWLSHYLGIDTYGRVIFDTLFAMHTVDEYADLKLERLAVKFTDLGRYDIPLLVWKKKNGVKDDEGYGRIPDDILIVYSMKDVDTVFRATPLLTKMLIDDDVWDYYQNIKLPFTTDGYAEMSRTGIPANFEDMDKQRTTFIYLRDKLEEIFIEKLQEESFLLLAKNIYVDTSVNDVDKAMAIASRVELDMRGGTKHTDIENYLKQVLGQDYLNVIDTVEHVLQAPGFKHRSSKKMGRWLFRVKKYIPVKTTSNDGMPGISWETVLQQPEERQKEYTPAVDKDTLQIYADGGDTLLMELMEFKAIATVTSTFLRPQDEDGNEDGLVKHIAGDGRVHANYMSTETNRPRTFSPNILNIPKFF